jgi:phospholipid/cholesterol/gamma-HCH transport system substrate-binding protein
MMRSKRSVSSLLFMKKNVSETIIGFIVILVVCCFSFFVYSQTYRGSEKMYVINAMFDRIDGILVGSDIKMSGVKIGKVKNIHLDPKTYRAVATLMIDQDLDIPYNSMAAVVSEGFMGGKYMNITPSGHDDHIPKDGTGKITMTQSSVSLESLIGKYIFNSQKDTNASNANK